MSVASVVNSVAVALFVDATLAGRGNLNTQSRIQ